MPKPGRISSLPLPDQQRLSSINDPNQPLVRRVTLALAEKGWTWQRLSEESGVAMSTVRSFSSNPSYVRMMRPQTLFKLCRPLNIVPLGEGSNIPEGEDWKEYEARDEESRKRWHEAREKPRLLHVQPVEVFEGSTGSTAEDVDWVARNVMTKAPKAKDAPSARAWGMLAWVRQNVKHQSTFWATIYPKYTSSVAQQEAQQRFTDDGRELSDLIGRVEQASERSLESALRRRRIRCNHCGEFINT